MSALPHRPGGEEQERKESERRAGSVHDARITTKPGGGFHNRGRNSVAFRTFATGAGTNLSMTTAPEPLNTAAMPAHFALHAGRNRTPVRAVVGIDADHRRHLPAVQAAQLRIVHVVGLEA